MGRGGCSPSAASPLKLLFSCKSLGFKGGPLARQKRPLRWRKPYFKVPVKRRHPSSRIGRPGKKKGVKGGKGAPAPQGRNEIGAAGKTTSRLRKNLQRKGYPGRVGPGEKTQFSDGAVEGNRAGFPKGRNRMAAEGVTGERPRGRQVQNPLLLSRKRVGAGGPGSGGGKAGRDGVKEKKAARFSRRPEKKARNRPRGREEGGEPRAFAKKTTTSPRTRGIGFGKAKRSSSRKTGSSPEEPRRRKTTAKERKKKTSINGLEGDAARPSSQGGGKSRSKGKRPSPQNPFSTRGKKKRVRPQRESGKKKKTPRFGLQFSRGP